MHGRITEPLQPNHTIPGWTRIVLSIRIVHTKETNLRKTRASLLRRRNELSVLIRQKETFLRTRCMDPLVQLHPSIYDVLVRAARKCCQDVERGDLKNKHHKDHEWDFPSKEAILDPLFLFFMFIPVTFWLTVANQTNLYAAQQIHRVNAAAQDFV